MARAYGAAMARSSAVSVASGINISAQQHQRRLRRKLRISIAQRVSSVAAASSRRLKISKHQRAASRAKAKQRSRNFVALSCWQQQSLFIKTKRRISHGGEKKPSGSAALAAALRKHHG